MKDDFTNNEWLHKRWSNYISKERLCRETI